MIARMSGEVALAYAFVEREIALSKRYWAWEVMWIVYGVVTSLSVALIGRAAPTISGQPMDDGTLSRFVLYLLVGSVAWRFLGIVFENITEVIAWERWEGTIEYTFMAPVHRLTHLLGMSISSVLRATASRPRPSISAARIPSSVYVIGDTLARAWTGPGRTLNG